MNSTNLSLCFVCLFVLVGELSAFLSKPSTMVLQNNEFRNFVVAIHENIPEDKSYIDKLKDIFTKASQKLYTATRRRAFFKEIKILVPSTWSNDASYRAASTSENLNFADVILTDPIRGKRSLPQTRSYAGCGKQGIHILLTKDFLDNPGAMPFYNDPAKYFVHAFAQFRWGVFQEYSEEGEPVFYMSAYSGHPEAVRCTYMIRGLVQKNDAANTICYLEQQAQSQHVVASVDPNTGLYDADCQWKPYPSHQRAQASIMDHQYISTLDTFCDDDEKNYMTIHNYEAPSKHNRLCSHRSTWDVITSTDDFSGGQNPARNLTEIELTPTFIVIKSSARKRRALLNISTDILKQPHVADKVKQAVGHYIHETSHSSNQELFVLHRDQNVTKFLPINTVDDLHSVFRRDVSAVGMASLDDQHDALNDSHVISITESYITDDIQTKEDTRNGRTKISTIIMDNTDLSNKEASHLYVSSSLGHSLQDRIRHVLQDHSTNGIIISQTQYQLSDQPVSDGFHIDETLSDHITILLHYNTELPFIDLRSPSDVIYGTESVTCSIDHDYKIIKFHFDFIEVGEWKYTLRQSSTTNQMINITVLSDAGSSQIDPIVLRQSVQFHDETQSAIVLHVDATQGVHPVIGLEVTARIELTDLTVTTVKLLDNGAGADISKNDGIYSRYFLPPNQIGMYHVTFVVTGTKGNIFKKEESFIFEADNALTPIRKHVHKRSINGNIQRHVFGGTIHKQQQTLSRIMDHHPPSRIFDLHTVRYIPYRKTLVLSWTAPGDDLDNGKAFAYEIFIGANIKDVKQFLLYVNTGRYNGAGWVTKKTLPVKVEATSQETLLLNIAGSANTYLFSVRAVDKYGNVGEASNVATAVIIDNQNDK